MLRTIILAAAILTSAAASAARIHITSDDKGFEYLLYSESTALTKDGVFATVGQFNKKTKQEVRNVYGVTFADCQAGFGAVNSRDNTGAWSEVSKWADSGQTVGDSVAIAICNAFKYAKKQN